MLLTTSYLPPCGYIKKIIDSGKVTIDADEHFVKQTIRSRCHILSPNGVQSLIIPVEHNNRTKTPIKDIQISNSSQWQRQHWRSLNAAYRRSAFFEFYMDDFEPFYSNEFKYLFDFNNNLLNKILELTYIKAEINITDKFIEPFNSEEDQRGICNTGTPSVDMIATKYSQVFTSKFGFTPGLSFIDLLFNTGPGSLQYLNGK